MMKTAGPMMEPGAPVAHGGFRPPGGMGIGQKAGKGGFGGKGDPTYVARPRGKDSMPELKRPRLEPPPPPDGGTAKWMPPPVGKPAAGKGKAYGGGKGHGGYKGGGGGMPPQRPSYGKGPAFQEGGQDGGFQSQPSWMQQESWTSPGSAAPPALSPQYAKASMQQPPQQVMAPPRGPPELSWMPRGGPQGPWGGADAPAAPPQGCFPPPGLPPAPPAGLPPPPDGPPALPSAPGLPEAPARLVLLAPATAGITVQSSRPPQLNNKQIAMQFVNSDKAMQAAMLRDPNVARAILQTLAENPQSTGGGLAGGPGGLAGAGGLPGPPPAALADHGPAAAPPSASSAAPSAPPAVAPAKPSAWSGGITLARNAGKRLPTRATLLHGRVQDVEVALRSAAQNGNLLDITHRVPFEEVARRAPGTILCLAAQTHMEQAQLEEYIKYFRSKMRAGVARLDGSLALYILPPVEDVPSLRDALYAPYPDVPRAGCLLGLIAPGTTAAPMQAKAKAEVPAPAPPKGKDAKTEAAPAAAEKEAAAAPPAEEAAPAAAAAGGAAASAPAQAAGGDAAEEDGDADGGDGGLNVSSKELMDLFSNPELIKLLSDDKEES